MIDHRKDRTKATMTWLVATAWALSARAVFAGPQASAEAGRLGVSAAEHIFAVTPGQWHEPIEKFLADPESDPVQLNDDLAKLAEQYPLGSSDVAESAHSISRTATAFYREYSTRNISDTEIFVMTKQLAALNLVLRARGVSADDRSRLVIAVELGSRKLPPDLNKILGFRMRKVAAALGPSNDAAEVDVQVQAAGYQASRNWPLNDASMQAALRRLRRLKQDQKILVEQVRMPGYGMLGDIPEPGIFHLPGDAAIAQSLYQLLRQNGLLMDSLKAVFPGIDLFQTLHDRTIRRRAFWRRLGLSF